VLSEDKKSEFGKGGRTIEGAIETLLCKVADSIATYTTSRPFSEKKNDDVGCSGADSPAGVLRKWGAAEVGRGISNQPSKGFVCNIVRRRHKGARKGGGSKKRIRGPGKTVGHFVLSQTRRPQRNMGGKNKETIPVTPNAGSMTKKAFVGRT